MNKAWFEFDKIRKRKLGDLVWVPLWTNEEIHRDGEFGYLGYRKEYYGVHTVAIPLARAEEAKKLSWTDLTHAQGVYATKDIYKPAEVYQKDDGDDFGIELALVQQLQGETDLQLNQDVAFALHLKREVDFWLKPDEDYVVVARIRRDSAGEPIALEIKNDFLRDYLCARRMFLRTVMYRDRVMIVADAAELGSPVPLREDTESERFEIRVDPMVEGGHFGNATYAVMRVSRTDIDSEDDVPVPGRETNDNTESESWTGRHEGRTLLFVAGEWWRDENIEPAKSSLRVRGDDVPTGISYIIDAMGARATSEELDNEDNARWLWFRPDVISAITGRRSGRFRWYTQETGGVGFSRYDLTHFGINSAGLINVYAYDIARLPLWQQQIWAGYNIGPEGGVSAELLASQMQARPARTSAPEEALAEIMRRLDELFLSSIGEPLFRPHAETEVIVSRISRFRADSPQGLFSLAKDLMRVIVDQINLTALQKRVPPPKGQKWGTLKSLEHYLATIVGTEQARAVVGPLVGAYELRLADAHMPKGALDEAYKLARVDPSQIFLKQGFWLVASVASALIQIGRIMESEVPA